MIVYHCHDNFHSNCNGNGVLVYFGDDAFDVVGNGVDDDVGDCFGQNADGGEDAGYVVDNGGADIGI